MKHLVKFLLLATVVLSISSCEKQTHQKLIGKWKLYIGENKGYEEYWTFTETSVARSLVFPDTTYVANDGTYEMKGAKKFSIVGANSGMNGVEYFRGDWNIESIDSKSLILNRQIEGLMYNEFEKK